MTDTATVETLTAEVRVLMVGSRQVTLSVARQLDIVPLAELTVFGRVKINQDKINRDKDYVIGSDRDGRLAISEYYGNPMSTPFITRRDLVGSRITVCRTEVISDGQVYSLNYRGRRIEVETNAAQQCDVEHTSSTDGCGTWHANGLDDQIQRSIIAYDAMVARQKDAAQSPLIVLAGLR